MAFDPCNYVAPSGSGYVVLVGCVWYGPPDCRALGSSSSPPSTAIWSSLTDAQNCYNLRRSGSTQPPPSGGLVDQVTKWVKDNPLVTGMIFIGVISWGSLFGGSGTRRRR